MQRSSKSIKEAEAYIYGAEKVRENLLEQDSDIWNPVVVNCIMAMIKCNDALMLENRGHTNKDHSTTANELQEMYEERMISQDFKSNLDSVRKWVVDKKTEIQYRNAKVSLTEADRCLKASKRFLEKTRKELNLNES
ncbi:hypothetical protein [Candidatus Nanohalovita haloferacivicina]|uniref:hypothetical protein n=1 Tax=Candidatus Nanohalovita haloferacivicina TaxID=2978046 RepID=UPI00325FCD67